MSKYYLRVKLVESVLKFIFQKLCHPILHRVSQLLCTGDPLDSAHITEFQLVVHELCHALVQLLPGANIEWGTDVIIPTYTAS